MNLKNKRILITRPRAQSQKFANSLAAQGAQPVFFPVIEIVPAEDVSVLDRELKNLGQYDWLIFTSVHGVEAFFNRLDALDIKRLPPRIRVAAVGPRTARALSDRSVWVEHVPDEYVPEALLPGFGSNLYGKRFLLPQSNLARTELAGRLRASGALVNEVIAYRTVPSEPNASEVDALRSGVDVITFTSPSTVHNFVQIVRKNGLDPLDLPGAPLIACIGPVTRKAAEEAGLLTQIAPEQYTTDGLVAAIGSLVVN
jgi:uroporphyrinogen III methyltransferase/synthase